MYSDTSIRKTPLGSQSCIWRCSYFVGFVCTHVNAGDLKWDRAMVAAFERCPLVGVSQ